MPHQIIWSWYTGRWWVGCYILVQRGGYWAGPQPGQAPSRCTNVTAYPSTASVPITVLLYNGPLLYGFNVGSKGLSKQHPATKTRTKHRTKVPGIIPLSLPACTSAEVNQPCLWVNWRRTNDSRLRRLVVYAKLLSYSCNDCSMQLWLLVSVVRYPRYLDTYRRYLRDDTSIAKVTIYRGIS